MAGTATERDSDPADTRERELKYVLPAGRVPFAERWLAAVCRPDPSYGRADVWTVYYDTAEQRSLREKINSDYLKTKLRVRWYAAPGGAAAGDAFLEVKRRVGDRREKIRVVLDGVAGDLAGRPLADRVWRELPGRLAPAGVSLQGVWQPVLAIVYRRSRFVDAASGARVSCDGGIRAAAVRGGVLPGWHGAPLPVGVVEVKGRSDELPVNLRSLVRFDARLSAFSKYAAVWAHMQPPAARAHA
jgi:hypothetical protein